MWDKYWWEDEKRGFRGNFLQALRNIRSSHKKQVYEQNSINSEMSLLSLAD